MSYFNNFPKTFYTFGDGNEESYVQDISLYAEVLDEVKDVVTLYQDYYIQDQQRPDQVSMLLYNDPTLHWTFYLLNDHIREQGWPLCNEHVIEKSKKDHPGITLTTREVIFDKFTVGQTITGNTSGATGTIVHRNLDLGQIILENVTGNFLSDEYISSVDESQPILIESVSPEYLSAYYYEDGEGNHVDIDPTVGPGSLFNEVTHLDHDMRQNESLKSIKVLNKDSVIKVTSAFREAMRS